jgi:hypothetical protein
MTLGRVAIVTVVGALLAGCPEEKRSAPAADAALPTPVATTAAAPSRMAPDASAAAPDAAEAQRFDPKHKCPTGQTHFYFEGDFCRRRCFTNGDCAKGERCNPIEYPFVVDGGTAGKARFCEGV